MNARQIANGTSSAVNSAAEFVSRDPRVDSLYKITVSSALTLLTFMLGQNYFDWRDKISQIPQIAAENAELRRQIFAIPSQIESVRPDPFTGTQGKLLDQRITRNEIDIERLGSRVTVMERDR